MYICEYCGNEHDGSYGSGRFCSSKCARKFSNKYVTSEGRKRQIEILTDPSIREINNKVRREKSENFIKNENGEFIKVKKKKSGKTKMKNNTHSQLTGKLGEYATIKKFIEHGIQVYIPVVDIYGADMIVEIDHEYKKIQVKSSTSKCGVNDTATQFKLTHYDRKIDHNNYYQKPKKYTQDEVDYFALYDVTSDNLFLVENNENTVSNMIIRNNLSTNKKGHQTSKINLASDYDFDKVIENLKNGIKESNIIDISDKDFHEK